MQCPVCKAENVAGPACRRCKADLTSLVALEECRDVLLAASHEHLVRGESLRAAERALLAQRYRDGEDARRALAVATLLHRDFGSALRYWQHVQELRSSA
jgi:hypothetical protein